MVRPAIMARSMQTRTRTWKRRRINPPTARRSGQRLARCSGPCARSRDGPSTAGASSAALWPVLRTMLPRRVMLPKNVCKKIGGPPSSGRKNRARTGRRRHTRGGGTGTGPASPLYPCPRRWVPRRGRRPPLHHPILLGSRDVWRDRRGGGFGKAQPLAELSASASMSASNGRTAQPPSPAMQSRPTIRRFFRCRGVSRRARSTAAAGCLRRSSRRAVGKGATTMEPYTCRRRHKMDALRRRSMPAYPNDSA